MQAQPTGFEQLFKSVSFTADFCCDTDYYAVFADIYAEQDLCNGQVSVRLSHRLTAAASRFDAERGWCLQQISIAIAGTPAARAQQQMWQHHVESRGSTETCFCYSFCDDLP